MDLTLAPMSRATINPVAKVEYEQRNEDRERDRMEKRRIAKQIGGRRIK